MTIRGTRKLAAAEFPPIWQVSVSEATRVSRYNACSMTRQGVMEVRNGFIVGIFNYCDRWCDACAFTSRCRLFADGAEIKASLDPGLKALVRSEERRGGKECR